MSSTSSKIRALVTPSNISNFVRDLSVIGRKHFCRFFNMRKSTILHENTTWTFDTLTNVLFHYVHYKPDIHKLIPDEITACSERKTLL